MKPIKNVPKCLSPGRFTLPQVFELTAIPNLLKANSNSSKVISNPMRKLSTKATLCAAIYRIIYTKAFSVSGFHTFNQTCGIGEGCSEAKMEFNNNINSGN